MLWSDRILTSYRSPTAVASGNPPIALDSSILGEPDSRELPARVGGEEVAVGRPDVRARRGARAAAEHVLVAHELAVVFAQGTGQRPIARIGCVRALGPLPDIAEELFGEAAAGLGAGDQRAVWKRSVSRKLPPLAVSTASAAATSHSASVGSRAPAQRAYASAS